MVPQGLFSQVNPNASQMSVGHGHDVPFAFCQVGSHEGTKETFQLIAHETGGQFSDLSPDSLIHAVCTSVLMDIGGEELVMEYRERFQ